jgi:hypothetical protein
LTSGPTRFAGNVGRLQFGGEAPEIGLNDAKPPLGAIHLICLAPYERRESGRKGACDGGRRRLALDPADVKRLSRSVRIFTGRARSTRSYK